MASPAVLGHLFFNRMQGAAYSVLKKRMPGRRKPGIP